MENPSLIPESDMTPEQIQHQMAQTRESLTEKVAALEHQVVGTVQSAADSITGTVEAVKSLVGTAPGAVSDGVKQAADVLTAKVQSALDISGQVQRNPWAAVGISAGVGFLTGLLLFRERQSAPIGSSQGVAPTRLAPVVPTTTPGVLDELSGMLGKKLREVAENVINTATSAVNDSVHDHVPKLVDTATVAAIDQLKPATTGPESRINGFYAT